MDLRLRGGNEKRLLHSLKDAKADPEWHTDKNAQDCKAVRVAIDRCSYGPPVMELKILCPKLILSDYGARIVLSYSIHL